VTVALYLGYLGVVDTAVPAHLNNMPLTLNVDGFQAAGK